MVLLKPGKMRWDYKTPDRQVIICDGKKILMYFAKLSQMLVSDANQYLESDVAYSFFVGNGKLRRDFQVSYAPDEERDEELGRALKIVPKGRQPQIDYVLIWPDKGYLIRRLAAIDKTGRRVEFRFSNIKINPEVDDEIFTFTPPAGTEVVSQ